MALSGSKLTSSQVSLVGAHTDAVVYTVHGGNQHLVYPSAPFDFAASRAYDAANGTHYANVLADGYVLRGVKVNVYVCSTVDEDQTVSIKNTVFTRPTGQGGLETAIIENETPMTLSPNNVIQVGSIPLESDTVIKVSCTKGVDVRVAGIVDIGVA